MGSERSRVRVYVGLSFALALTGGAGCQVVGGYESFEGKSGSPGPSVEPHPCDGLPGTKPDERALSTLVLVELPDGTCFWIDEVEVTVEQYRAFLDADATASPGADDVASCGWKTAPSDPERALDDDCASTTATENQPFGAKKPIRCLDWCDAQAFCAWAGKSLCGGSYVFGGVTRGDTRLTWRSACSEPDSLYPYGGTSPVREACNIGIGRAQCLATFDGSACAPTTVPSAPPFHCRSPSGAEDMLGNVAEWTSVCGRPTGTPAEAEQCEVLGGSFDDPLEEITCQTSTFRARGTRDRRVGFRCCDALSAAEEQLTRVNAP